MFGRRVVFHLRELNPLWADLLARLPETDAVESVENKLIVTLQDPESTNPLIINTLVKEGAEIQFVGEIRHSLEQLYLEMVHSNEKGQA